MDTTSNYHLSASSSSPLWDVFLSFYGNDTRRNFIANLYFALDQAGILTFRDDPSLEKGQEISLGLLDAIRHSKMFIVVISENYACSSWCLNELIEILNYNRTKNRIVPVFYYVDPSDLRHQRRSFGEALDLHKKHYTVDMIEKWKSALAEIANLSGYHLKVAANENELDTIQKIVEDVASQVSRKIFHLEEYLLGIDPAIEEVYQKISLESNDVRAIGICGMGGIGKTTIAKVFYNKYSNKFDASCFIKNIKQNSQGGSPLLFLLQQLLVELLRRKGYKVLDLERGFRQLKHFLCSRRALIILDDLDQSSHSELLARVCKLFSAGSRIVVTTRDVNLLNKLKVDILEVDIYMVKLLGQKDSLELFTYHAFRKTMPPETLGKLSVKFATYAEGLPLALKVLGSSLRGRTDVQFWKAKLEKVGKIPENKIQKILQLSYDELEEETEKAIFLDIAFFFVGNDKDEAVHIFNSCGFYPNSGIPILMERCLLTIGDDNKFQMHNLIQNMGRELGKGSRSLLCGDNAWEELQNLEIFLGSNQGTSKIEGLILDLTRSRQKLISAKTFERMPKLRLLQIKDADGIKGSFENSFHELRCIRWHYCQWTRLPSSFRPQKLVSLDMPFSKFKMLWKSTMQAVSLKTINVSYSANLKMTPNFRDVTRVEKLLLCGCKSLQKVHVSIGQLPNLCHLDLSECGQLKELPERIGQLTELVHLDLRYCHNLKRLPESIKQLTNLAHLDMGGCHNLKRLPEQLGDMQGLKMLDASNTIIELLPDSVAQMRKLNTLKLYSCKKLKKLPDIFGNMEGLKLLDLSYSGIEQLPDSFGSLIQLLVLKSSNCKNLKCLPSSLGNLSSLGALTLIGNGTQTKLPDSFKNMEQLETLFLSCDIQLCLPIISNMSSLKILTLLDEGESFSSTKLFSLSKLSNLQKLQLIKCTSLRSSFPELPHNLKFLSVSDNATLEQLPDLSSLKQLNKLHILRCISLNSLSSLPPHLEKLSISDCTSLKNLPDLSMLKDFVLLDLTRISGKLKMSLKNSLLQIRRDFFYSFRTNLSNIEFLKLFGYKSIGCTVSFDIPPNLGDNILGVVLWFDYTFKTIGVSSVRAVVMNKTQGTINNYDIKVYVDPVSVGEVRSGIECIEGETISLKSGDRIMVTFERLLQIPYMGFKFSASEVDVEMCGVHVIQKTPNAPC